MGVFCVCVWGGTWEVRDKADCCDGLWDCYGERRPKSCGSAGRQKEGYGVHRQRETCNEYVKGEGKGYEVQRQQG